MRCNCLGLLTLVALFAGCRCGPKVEHATSDVAVSPGALDFGEIALGAALPLTLELTDHGLAPAGVELSVDGPFALSTASVSISGGSSVQVTGTFTPARPGPATG